MIARSKTQIRQTLAAAGKVGGHWMGTDFDGARWVSNGYFVAKLGSDTVADILDTDGIAMGEEYRPSLAAAVEARESVLEDGSVLVPRILDGTDLPLYARMPDGRMLVLLERGVGVVAIDQAQIDAVEAVVGRKITRWRGDHVQRPVVGVVETSNGLEAVAVLMPVRLD